MDNFSEEDDGWDSFSDEEPSISVNQEPPVLITGEQPHLLVLPDPVPVAVDAVQNDSDDFDNDFDDDFDDELDNPDDEVSSLNGVGIEVGFLPEVEDPKEFAEESSTGALSSLPDLPDLPRFVLPPLPKSEEQEDEDPDMSSEHKSESFGDETELEQEFQEHKIKNELPPDFVPPIPILPMPVLPQPPVSNLNEEVEENEHIIPEPSPVVDQADPVPVEEPVSNDGLQHFKSDATSWTLDSDTKLLKYITEWGQKLTSKTKEVENEVQSLAFLAKSMDIKVHNTLNSFLLLSNSQFVENRVYDEDEAIEPVVQEEPKTLTKEESEAILTPKYIEAIGHATSALDMYTTIRNDVDNTYMSEDSGEGNIDAMETGIITKHDEWSKRSLPFIIGTRQFEEDDHCGLQVDIYSDDDIAIDDDEDSVEQDEDEVFYSSDEEAVDVPIDVDIYGSPSASDEESQGYRDENDQGEYEEPEQEQPSQEEIAPAKSFHDALQESLINRLNPKQSTVEDVVEEKQEIEDGMSTIPDPVLSKAEEKRNKIKSIFDDDDEDLLNNVRQEALEKEKKLKQSIFDDEDDLLGQIGNKSSLLNDLDSATKPSKVDASESTTESKVKKSIFDEEDEFVKPTQTTRKTSIFDDDEDLDFSAPQSKSHKKTSLFDDIEETPVNETKPESKKTSIFDDVEEPVPETKTDTKKKTSIFEDEDELITDTKPESKKKTSIFDDVEDSIPETKLETKKKTSIFDDVEESVPETKPETKKKTSIFEDEDELITDTKPESKKKTSIFDDVEEPVLETKQESKKKTSIFDDVEDSIPETKLETKKKTSIFDDVEESVPENKPETKKKTSIFDDVEDTSVTETKPESKKTSIFDDVEEPVPETKTDTKKKTSIFDDVDEPVPETKLETPQEINNETQNPVIPVKEESPMEPIVDNIFKTTPEQVDTKTLESNKDIVDSKPTTEDVKKKISIFSEENGHKEEESKKSPIVISGDKDIKRKLSIFEDAEKPIISIPVKEDSNRKISIFDDVDTPVTTAPKGDFKRKLSIFDEIDGPLSTAPKEDAKKRVSIFDEDSSVSTIKSDKKVSIFEDVMIPKEEKKSTLLDIKFGESETPKSNIKSKLLDILAQGPKFPGSMPPKPSSNIISNIFDSPDNLESSTPNFPIVESSLSQPTTNPSARTDEGLLADPNLSRAKQSGRRPPSRLRKPK